jgi:NADH dehydrogenase [ubiquinone] 1 alpha subcomplex assembly factor 5
MFSRRPYLHRNTIAAASAIYKGLSRLFTTLYGSTLLMHHLELHGDNSGTIPATFQIIYMVKLLYFRPVLFILY